MSAQIQDINKAIVAAAATNPSPDGENQSLSELYSLVSAAGIANTLDALVILSALLPSKDLAARDIIAIMGECSSAKDVVMAVQEEMEKITEQAEDGNEGVMTEKTSLTERLIELVELCGAVVPRLKLRKRSASDMLQPLLSNIQSAVEAVSPLARLAEVEALMIAMETSVNRIFKWVKELPAIDAQKVTECQLGLKSVLEHALILFRPSLRYSTGQQALEACFPRLQMSRQVAGSTEDQNLKIMDAYLSTYGQLVPDLGGLTCSPSIVSVVLLVHSWLTSASWPDSFPSSFLPSLLDMLQPNSNLQEDALAFLLLALHRNQRTTKNELPPDIVNALMPHLTVVSSIHPSSPTRHQAFRVVSLLLTSSPTQLRLQLLTDLVAKCEYPQMRIAAVGLVKDAVLEGFESPTNTSAFGTPMFMRVFGPLLFRPSPHDLFGQGTNLKVEEFLESPEPKRIIEVLSLYYVVLLRDKANKTGIRDKDMLSTVEKSLLNPLADWLQTVVKKDDEGHTMMLLISLRMGLNRIIEAKAHP